MVFFKISVRKYLYSKSRVFIVSSGLPIPKICLMLALGRSLTVAALFSAPPEAGKLLSSVICPLSSAFCLLNIINDILPACGQSSLYQLRAVCHRRSRLFYSHLGESGIALVLRAFVSRLVLDSRQGIECV